MKASQSRQLMDIYARTKGVGLAIIGFQRHDGKKTLLTLNHVLFCPEFASNLVSVSKLLGQGIYWETRSPHCRLRLADDTVLGDVCPSHYIFLLDRTTTSQSVRAAIGFRRSTIKSSSSATTERWHLRLGHASDEATTRLARQVESLDVRLPHKFVCEACRIAKAKHLVGRVLRPVPEFVLEQIAIDFHDL